MFQTTQKALTIFLTLVQFVAQVSGASSSEETYSSISIPPSSTSSSASPSATAANGDDTKLHVVTVGKLTWRFIPDTITANVGDVVYFQFFPPNHSVVRAEYEYPCIPYEMTGPQKTGFFSGFHPIDVVSNEPPSWNLTINDTAPIFFYCSAPGSCIQQGMVGVINPNKTETIAVQRAYAKNSTFMLNPGEPFPVEASSVVTLTQAPTLTSPATVTTSNTLLSATPVPPSPSQGLSSVAVAGIVVGAIVALTLLGALFVYISRKRSSGSDKGGTAIPLMVPLEALHPAYREQKYNKT